MPVAQAWCLWAVLVHGGITVFAGIRRRKLCHLGLGTAKPACWTQNRQVVWFGTVWGSGFAVRSWELVIIFVCEPVLQTSQVLFCFAQIRQTSVLIKRHVTMLKWKWWFCSNNLSLFFKHFTLNCCFDMSPWFSRKSQASHYLLSWASVGWHLPAHGRGSALT